jgi:hypothetical protein
MQEEELYLLLQKIGSDAGTDAPAVLDADDDNRPVLETYGDPGPIVLESPDPPEPQLKYAQITKSNMWVHHDAHPVVLDVLLLKQYGTDWFVWEAKTLWSEIMDDFKVPSISDHTKAKIQAIKTLHINEWFWTKWEVFCWVTQALNNNLPDFQVLQKPSLSQLMNAVEVSGIVRGGEEFSQELQIFVAAAIMDDGVLYSPKPLEFCQDEIVEFLSRKNKDAIPLIRKTETRVSEYLRGDTVLDETPDDVQAAKIIVARKYVELRKEQMKHQLELIK